MTGVGVSFYHLTFQFGGNYMKYKKFVKKTYTA